MIEVRAITSEVRAVGEEGKSVSGLGIVYDAWTEIFPGFKERILKGAAKPAAMVRSFFNHNPDQVLSTLESNPALEIKETDKGVEFTSPIPPTSYGKDLEINLERGNVRGASFAFNVNKNGDKWWEEKGVTYREISDLVYEELGPVTNPAYLKTNVQLRSAQEAVEQWRAAQTPPEPPAPEVPPEPWERNICVNRQIQADKNL